MSHLVRWSFISYPMTNGLFVYINEDFSIYISEDWKIFNHFFLPSLRRHKLDAGGWLERLGPGTFSRLESTMQLAGDEIDGFGIHRAVRWPSAVTQNVRLFVP